MKQVTVAEVPEIAAVFVEYDGMCTMNCGKPCDNIYGGMCNACWWDL